MSYGTTNINILFLLYLILMKFLIKLNKARGNMHFIGSKYFIRKSILQPMVSL